MLKWLFGKSLNRTTALEAYLARFNARELAYMNDNAIQGIFFRLLARQDAFPTIDLVSYIHAALQGKAGRIPDTLAGYAAERVRVRTALAKAMTAWKEIDFMEFGERSGPPFRTGVEPSDAEEERRLGLHVTMLERIYGDQYGANLLPELEAFGEAQAWEQYWRPQNA
jgi:hypothetical protein